MKCGACITGEKQHDKIHARPQKIFYHGFWLADSCDDKESELDFKIYHEPIGAWFKNPFLLNQCGLVTA